MTDTPKKLIVTVEAMVRITAWLEQDREVHMFVCPDMGCLAVYFSPEPAIDCQKHAHKCACTIQRQSVLADALEIEPPPEPLAPDAPQTWKIMTLDVLGNEGDGYEVNASYYSGREIELAHDASDKQVRDALVESGYLSKASQVRYLEFIGDDDVINVNRLRDGRPLLTLMREG